MIWVAVFQMNLLFESLRGTLKMEVVCFFSTINNTMQILHYQNKSTHLNTVERYYIHAEFSANNHLIDSQNIFHNPIFDAILKTHQQ